MKSTSASLLSKHVKRAYSIAAALWIASLFLPAAVINGSMRLVGYRVFMIGIDALGSGIFGWLANPLMAAAIVAGLLRRWLMATLFAALALLGALTSFHAVTIARGRDDLPIDEVSFDAGFFLWLAASSLILATSVYALVRSRQADS